MEARFNTASHEEIQGAEVADVYFHRTMEVLRARGAEHTPVHVEVTLKSSDPEEWFVVAGLDEVARLLEDVEVEARAVREGTVCRPHDPILTLTGPYANFAEHETAILGFLCQASGIATGAARCRLAAGDRPVISFGARRMHPAITPMIERTAYLGGCDSVAVDLAAKRIGIPATGTLPHALALVLGSTHEATKAFDEVIAEDVNRTILIDTFDDEKFGAMIAAKAIPDSIYAVRLDTPGSRRGQLPRADGGGSLGAGPDRLSARKDLRLRWHRRGRHPGTQPHLRRLRRRRLHRRGPDSGLLSRHSRSQRRAAGQARQA